MEDIKKLKALLDEYKQIGKKKMADGGQVEKPHDKKNLKQLKGSFDKFVDEEGQQKMWKGGMYSDGYADGEDVKDQDQNPILDVIHAIGKSFNPPKASATPSSSPSQDDKYKQIREQNAQNFGHSSAGYSDGGEVEQDENNDDQDSNDARQKREEEAIKKAFYNKGGKVRKYADGAAPVESDDDDSDESDDNSNVAAAPVAPASAPAPVVSQAPDNNVKMDLGDIPIMAPKAADEGPYPGEEEDAEKVSDQSTAAQLALQDLDDDKLDELHAHVQAEKDKREGKDKEAESEEDKVLEDKMKGEELQAEEKAPEDKQEPDREVASDEEPDKQEEQPEPQSSLQQQLAKAQSDRQAILRADQMSRADELLAAGIAGHGATPASPAYINNGAMAQAPVQNLQEKLKLQQSDPMSSVSQVVRDYMTSKGLQVPKNASADDLYKVAPFLAKDQALQAAIQKVIMQQTGAAGRTAQNNQTKQQIADANRTAAMERQRVANEGKVKAAAAGQEAKQAKESRDAQVKAETDINSTRGKQALMLAQRNLMSVKNAEKMIKEFPDPNQWTAPQVALFNTEIGKIASNGVPTEAMLHELSNPTAAQGMSKLISQVVNVPVGAKQGEFIKLNLKYLSGLKDVAQQTITDNLGNTVKAYQPKLDSDSYKNLVYRHSDMLGLYSPAEERGINAVMKAKGMARQDAIKALIQEKAIKDVNY